jgi:hypothetical protein
MNLPFSAAQFLDVFASYNDTIWPIQILLNLLACAVIVSAIRKTNVSDRFITFSLAFLWFWMGLVYHIAFFARINPAAYGFGILFVLQGILLLLAGRRNRITYRVTAGWRPSVGSLLILYALLIYPLIGASLGHVFPASPTFGAPCPTTIFTFGVLLWGTGVRRHLIVIPALWSVVGFTAALTLGIREDLGLLIAGTAGTLIILPAAARRTVQSRE